jgi:hypothetical protein
MTLLQGLQGHCRCPLRVCAIHRLGFGWPPLSPTQVLLPAGCLGQGIAFPQGPERDGTEGPKAWRSTEGSGVQLVVDGGSAPTN